MQKAVITGGAGFIGSHLCDAVLNKGLEVTVLDNFSTGSPENLAHLKDHPRLKVNNRTLEKTEDLHTYFEGASHVFHLAALADIVPSIERPVDYFRANVEATVAVLEAARKAGVKRVLYAASSSCYGTPIVYPTHESVACKPAYPYAHTKYLGEQSLHHWGQVYGIETVSLRLFNVYGPRSRTQGTYGAMFGVFLAQMLAKQPFTIVGDGTQSRDFTYVLDVVDAFVQASEGNVAGEILNVGTGNPVSVNRVAEILGGERTYIPKRPGEPDCTHADVEKIASKLGWRAKVGIEEGIAQLLQHIDGWRDAPVWTPESISEATASWFQYLSEDKRASCA